MPPDWALRTRHFLRRFLERHFQPNDLGAVVIVGRGLVTDGHELTQNPRLLVDAVDKVQEPYHDRQS